MHPHRTLHLRRFPFVVGSIAFEAAWYRFVRQRSYPWRETLSSVGIHALRTPVRLLARLIVGPIALLFWTHRLATVPLDTAWGVALLFLGEEFAYYWSHRASHGIRWMWASHVVHHTPEHIHLASAFRLGVTGILSGDWLFRLPLYLLGLNLLAVSGMLAINLF